MVKKYHVKNSADSSQFWGIERRTRSTIGYSPVHRAVTVDRSVGQTVAVGITRTGETDFKRAFLGRVDVVHIPASLREDIATATHSGLASLSAKTIRSEVAERQAIQWNDNLIAITTAHRTKYDDAQQNTEAVNHSFHEVVRVGTTK